MVVVNSKLTRLVRLYTILLDGYLQGSVSRVLNQDQRLARYCKVLHMWVVKAYHTLIACLTNYEISVKDRDMFLCTPFTVTFFPPFG